MKPTKEEIELQLKELLNDLLEYGNQDGTIISLNYNKDTETCTVEMNVVITEEKGNPIPIVTFAGY